MHHFLVEQLKHTGKCTLPRLGTLTIQRESASIDIAEHKLCAGKQKIVFEESNDDDETLASYIQVCTKAPFALAKQKVNEFVNLISRSTKIEVPGLGTFHNNNSGVEFENAAKPNFFNAQVPAIKIVHRNVAHNMVVGDRETTTTQMSEYYNETPVRKDRWWIWALLLTLFGAGAILIYYFGDSLM